MTNSKQLTELFARLPEQDQQSLLDFALFLTHKNKDNYVDFPEPKPIDRAEGESVIAAIKRLKQVYFMLNMDSLIDETSTYMTQYMVQGRDVNEVIDDLEQSFNKHYENQKQEFES
jgi:hypothetical protein